MNYNKIYAQIIVRATARKDLSGYSERHHIIPKSLGGTNRKDNIVRLTSKEHFICHLCLCKMYSKNTPEWFKMMNALQAMRLFNKNHTHRYFTSNTYTKYRESFALVQSFNQLGNKNSQFGTVWINNTKIEKKWPKDKPVEAGWLSGRIKITKIKQKRKCNKCGEEECDSYICKKHQMIKTFIRHFGLNKNTLGSANFHIEFLKIVNTLSKL